MKQDPEHTIVQDELTGEKLLDGHEYDGIKELDNRLPKWWLGLFYLTIIFSAIYVLRYHVLKTGDLQAQEYEKEMAEAAEKYKPAQSDVSDAFAVTLLTDAASLEAGKVIYDKHCLVCHLSKGEGLVGPNLTDEYWIHGGSIRDVYDIIVVGVPAKGMISWKDQLKPIEIQQVSSFILSLQGTNPPNAKAPEGELYVPE
jgi:cytochrome c oxidase cbb3-type subunit 3